MAISADFGPSVEYDVSRYLKARWSKDFSIEYYVVLDNFILHLDGIFVCYLSHSDIKDRRLLDAVAEGGISAREIAKMTELEKMQRAQEQAMREQTMRAYQYGQYGLLGTLGAAGISGISEYNSLPGYQSFRPGEFKPLFGGMPDTAPTFVTTNTTAPVFAGTTIPLSSPYLTPEKAAEIMATWKTLAAVESIPKKEEPPAAKCWMQERLGGLDFGDEDK
jgi:hypothetical protein